MFLPFNISWTHYPNFIWWRAVIINSLIRQSFLSYVTLTTLYRAASSVPLLLLLQCPGSCNFVYSVWKFWNYFHSCRYEAYKPIPTCGIFAEKMQKLKDGCGDNGSGCVQKQMCCVIWSSRKDGPSVGWRWGRYLTSWIPKRSMDRLRLANRSVRRQSLQYKIHQTVVNHRASSALGTQFGSFIFTFVLRISRVPMSVSWLSSGRAGFSYRKGQRLFSSSLLSDLIQFHGY
jgi:hypothetical protein